MTKKKKEEKKDKPIFKDNKDPLMLVDQTKILHNLSISASFVALMQNVMIYILKDTDANEIVNTYKAIDDIITSEDKEKSLTEFQTHIYTLTTIVQYLRYEAYKQDALIPHKALTPSDLEPALKAFANQDFDTVRSEMESIMGKVKSTTVD